MYFLYADDSGDTGLQNSPSRYFCLSGLVVHETHWNATLDSIIDFRRRLRQRYGVKLREEIHSHDFLHKPGPLARIPKSIRLRILREVLDFQASLPNISIINICVDKSTKQPGDDVFGIAWQTLIQRFHNTLRHGNFPGPQGQGDHGLLIVDKTDEHKLRLLSRRMRRYNPVRQAYGTGTFQIPITRVLEDAVHRDSVHSYFVQLADVNAYFLHQRYAPSRYVRRKGARNYFNRLRGVLCTVASRTNPDGIVER